MPRFLLAAFSLAVLLPILSGCSFAPPDLSGVVAQGNPSQWGGLGEAGYSQAKDYIRPGTEGDEIPGQMRHRSLTALMGFPRTWRYGFVVPYISLQTLLYPALAAGVKYDRVYAAVYASSYGFRDASPFPFGWQVGVRANRYVTLSADSYLLRFMDWESAGDGPFAWPYFINMARAYRFTASLGAPGLIQSLKPTLIYVPEAEEWGAGLSIAFFGF